MYSSEYCTGLLLRCPFYHAWQLSWDVPANIGFVYGALGHDRKDIFYMVTKFRKSTGHFIMYSGITKIYDRKTVGHVFTKPVHHSSHFCRYAMRVYVARKWPLRGEIV
jgi:hypothetical protein